MGGSDSGKWEATAGVGRGDGLTSRSVGMEERDEVVATSGGGKSSGIKDGDGGRERDR